MFRLKVDEDIELELVNTFRTEEIYDVAMKNKERLEPWVLWIKGANIDNMNEFYEDMLKKYVKKRAFCCFVIYQGNFAGVVDISAKGGYGTKYGEIGYWLSGDYEKRGIMTKCVSKIIDLGFEHLDINSAVIRCASKNKNSCAIPKRLGFSLDGKIRGQLIVDNKEDTMHIWTLMRDEWMVKIK